MEKKVKKNLWEEQVALSDFLRKNTLPEYPGVYFFLSSEKEILYIGKAPACRHCYRLAYRSERETLDDRATRQSDKLRDRLGWIPGILHGNGPKPKGMHWRTFERLQARHDAYVAVSLAEMGRMLGIMESRLDKIRRR